MLENRRVEYGDQSVIREMTVAAAKPLTIRDRVVEMRRVPASELRANPKNFRTHPGNQRAALAGILQEIGIAGALTGRFDADGSIVLIDGHMRAEEHPEAEWPVLILDVDETEADLLLATLDPIGALAKTDAEKLADIINTTAVEDAAIGGLLRDLQESAGHFQTVHVDVSTLKTHPQNYRQHPPDQIKHIADSIQAHGFYRNVVLANDGTIIAGHGVVQAAKFLGIERIPVVQLLIGPDDPRALKVLTSDNEISNLAEVDDRMLTDLLRRIMQESPDGLDGTGFNEEQLAALTFVTRPRSEIGGKNEAAEWVGMPGYEEGNPKISIIMEFDDDESRQKFADDMKLQIRTRHGVWAAY